MPNILAKLFVCADLFWILSGDVLKKMFLENFAKLIQKDMYWSLLFDKVAGKRPEDSSAGISCVYCKIFKKTFFTEDI